MIKFTPCKSSMMILYIVGDKTYYNIHIILIPSYDFHYFKRAALFLWNKFFLKSTASFLVSKRLFMCLLQHIQLHGIPIYRLQFSLHSYFQLLSSYLRPFCFHVECICFSEKFTLPFFPSMTHYFCVKLRHLLCHSRQEYNKFVIDRKKWGKYLW